MTSVFANGELSNRQKLFCLYYSKLFNAAVAYHKAYGCSYQYAMSNGCRLKRNDKVKVEIERLLRYKAEDIMISESDILELPVRIAFNAIDTYIRWGVERVPYLHEGIPIVKTLTIWTRTRN